MPTINRGEVVRITATAATAPTPPVEVRVRRPSQAADESDGPYTMTDAGDGLTFTYSYATTEAGRHHYRATSAAPVAIEESSFVVVEIAVPD